jgi:hypothetical protein
VNTFVDVVMAATVVGLVSARQANSKKEKSLLSRVARAIPLSLKSTRGRWEIAAHCE